MPGENRSAAQAPLPLAGTPPPPELGAIRTAKPDFTLTAQELYDEYHDGKAEAHEKYGGKILQVSGVVTGCRASGKQALLNFAIKKEDGERSSDGAGCALQEPEGWARHGIGQKVTVKGTWGGRAYIGAAVVDAVVVEADPNPTALYPSEQLARDYEADPAAVLDRYDNQSVVVEGTVVKKEENKGAFAMLYLQGAGKTQVGCRFDFHEMEQAQPIKQGQKVKVYGEFSMLWSQENTPTLHACLLVTGQTTAQAPKPYQPPDPYRNTVREPKKVADLLAKAQPDVKLKPVEFALGGMPCTMAAPEGATVKGADGAVEIRHGPQFGEKFILTIVPGRSNLPALQKAWLNPKPPAEREDDVRTREYLIASDDTVLRRVLANRYSSWHIEYHFLVTGRVGHLDVHAFAPKGFAAPDCLLMIRCARTLTAKPGYKPPESLEALKKLGLEVTATDGGIDVTTNSNFTDGTVPYLVKALPGITHLRLWSPVTDEGLRHLAGLKKLKALALLYPEPGAIDGSGLAGLAGLTNLESLELNHTDITDAALVHLRGLKKLKKLKLTETPVGDAGIKNLTGLNALDELWIENTQVTDAGLAHLKALGKLSAIHAQKSKITAAGAADFKKTRPMVSVEIE
jgi:hypothetical protein